jgi:hypothetical protein
MFDELFTKANMKQRAKAYQIKFVKRWKCAELEEGFFDEESWKTDDPQLETYNGTKSLAAEAVGWIWGEDDPPDSIKIEIYADYGIKSEDEGYGHDTELIDEFKFNNPKAPPGVGGF